MNKMLYLLRGATVNTHVDKKTKELTVHGSLGWITCEVTDTAVTSIKLTDLPSQSFTRDEVARVTKKAVASGLKVRSFGLTPVQF